ncbi:MAG TPA: tetratricopeptide repeat protein [Candidatus Krumholzibacteria bacterium]|nr:tetratricopeptide repeat protein [Candidatus Krumholzibacteria bacterium]
MHDAPRPRRPRARRALAPLLAFALGGCAYFNTFYNANKLFEDAESIRTAKGSSAEKAAAQYDACIKKCHDLLRYHSKSKYVDDALYMIGVSHFHRAEYVQAQGSLRDLLDRFPNTKFAEGAWFHLGLASLAQGDAAGAAAAFENLERNYPNSPYRVEAAYRAAEAVLDAKDSESTRQALRQFIQENPHSRHVSAARLRIADTYYDDLHFPEARAEYQQALTLELTEEQRFEAELQISLTKRDEAELILADPALYTEQDLPSGLRVQMQEALADTAAAPSSAAATALPESLQAQRQQAMSLLAEAEVELERLRKRATKFNADPLLRIERAVTLAWLGKPEEALADLDQVARTDPRGETGSRAQYEIGEIHRRFGRWSKAQESYDLAQRGQGTSASPIVERAKKKSAAIRARTAAMEQLRPAAEVQRRWRVSRGLEPPRQGEADPRSGPDSLRSLVEIETRFEDLAGHLLRVAEIDLFELEQPWLALRECQQLLADYPRSGSAPRAALGIGWIYDRYLSEPGLAIGAYDRVTQEYPGSPQAQRAADFAAALRNPGAAVPDASGVLPEARGEAFTDTAGASVFSPGDSTAAAPGDTTAAPVDTTSAAAPVDSTAAAAKDTTSAAPPDTSLSP